MDTCCRRQDTYRL